MRDISIIGAGGTASHLIPALVKMVDPTETVIHVWDADTVEDKNLTRQMFHHFEVGQPKAQVWLDRFGTIISPHMEYVGDDNIDRAVRDTDIVLICADNMAVRRLIDRHAATLDNCVVINGGNEKSSGSVQTYIRENGRNQTPRISYHSPEIEADSADMAELSCAEIAVLPGGEQTMLANMTVAALMLQAYERVISRVATYEKTWTKLTFDIHSGVWQASDFRMHGDDWV